MVFAEIMMADHRVGRYLHQHVPRYLHSRPGPGAACSQRPASTSKTANCVQWLDEWSPSSTFNMYSCCTSLR